jgi:hypothetical protein
MVDLVLFLADSNFAGLARLRFWQGHAKYTVAQLGVDFIYIDRVVVLQRELERQIS